MEKIFEGEKPGGGDVVARKESGKTERKRIKIRAKEVTYTVEAKSTRTPQ